jgi:mannose/fructose/N-acetylgalactosamine-specific phosphotransferase system component IIC
VTATSLAVLAAWGVVVALDLIAVGQVMVARPIVAGTVAGAIVGDPVTGAAVGIVLELFALEVMPFGAARYADYGVGAVAAAAAAAGAPVVFGVGLGVAMGLVVALAGQVGIQFVRRANSKDMRHHEAAVDAGDAATIRALHYRGLLREVMRAVAMVAFGLGLGGILRTFDLLSVRGAVALYAAVVGVSLGNATVGASRLARAAGTHLLWLGAGFLVGLLTVMLR